MCLLMEEIDRLREWCALYIALRRRCPPELQAEAQVLIDRTRDHIELLLIEHWKVLDAREGR